MPLADCELERGKIYTALVVDDGCVNYNKFIKVRMDLVLLHSIENEKETYFLPQLKIMEEAENI